MGLTLLALLAVRFWWLPGVRSVVVCLQVRVLLMVVVVVVVELKLKLKLA
jgi:hypothetical protein